MQLQVTSSLPTALTVESLLKISCKSLFNYKIQLKSNKIKKKTSANFGVLFHFFYIGVLFHYTSLQMNYLCLPFRPKYFSRVGIDLLNMKKYPKNFSMK